MANCECCATLQLLIVCPLACWTGCVSACAPLPPSVRALKNLRQNWQAIWLFLFYWPVSARVCPHCCLCLCLASLGHLSQPVSAFALDVPRYPRGRCRPFLRVSQHGAKHTVRQQRKSASDCLKVLMPCVKMFSAMHEPESILFISFAVFLET